MTRRRAALVAWSLFAISVTLKLVAVLLVATAPPSEQPPDGLAFLIWTPGVLAFAAVGAVVASRRPQNAVGWVFLAVGVVEPFAMFADAYARQAMPAGELVALVAVSMNSSILGAIVAIILLFPNGRLPSRRWRPVMALLGVWFVTVAAATAVAPGPLDETLAIRNPIGLEGTPGAVAAAVRGGADAVGALLVLLAAPALLLRWRRAGPVERAQLKWFTYAVSLLVVLIVVVVPIWDWIGVPPAVDAVFTVLLVTVIAAIPISAGIAILRHRLYDIDLVIRRTVVYGAVIVVLAVVYAALIVALQAVLRPLTGENTVAVAVSTLAIAALFGPVRSRVREVVDRRFYRSRYDARQTLDVFAGQLRDQVELDAVAEALAQAVAGAVQPAATQVWIRGRRA